MSFLTQGKQIKAQTGSVGAIRPNGAEMLQLSGYVKNLLDTDIVVMTGNVNSTLVSGGGITWRGSGRLTKLVLAGKLNSFFPLFKVIPPMGAEEAERWLNRMPLYRLKHYEMALKGTLPRKGQENYYVVSREAVLVAYGSYGRSLNNLLIPVGGTRVVRGTGKKTLAQYIGLMPAWLMFEETAR